MTSIPLGFKWYSPFLFRIYSKKTTCQIHHLKPMKFNLSIIEMKMPTINAFTCASQITPTI